MTAEKFKREDRPGHIDPDHGARLLALSAEEHAGRSSDPASRGFTKVRAGGLGEELGEGMVHGATSGGADVVADDLEDVNVEEEGGPFVQTDASEEMADDIDASNPEDAERAPFPLA